jgi:hypothetical protein
VCLARLLALVIACKECHVLEAKVFSTLRRAGTVVAPGWVAPGMTTIAEGSAYYKTALRNSISSFLFIDFCDNTDSLSAAGSRILFVVKWRNARAAVFDESNKREQSTSVKIAFTEYNLAWVGLFAPHCPWDRVSC